MVNFRSIAKLGISLVLVSGQGKAAEAGKVEKSLRGSEEGHRRELVGKSLVFLTKLSGDAEVPPVETATSGSAKLMVSKDESELKFRLDISDGVGILAGPGAHLHCAPAGQNGGLIAFLIQGVKDPGFTGDIAISGSLTDDDIIEGPCGSDISGLVESMRDGNVYVNVHSAVNPPGEVRGQIA